MVNNLKNNIHVAKKILEDLIVSFDTSSISECYVGCNRSLDDVIMTSPDVFKDKSLKPLEAIAGRVLKNK